MAKQPKLSINVVREIRVTIEQGKAQHFVHYQRVEVAATTKTPSPVTGKGSMPKVLRDIFVAIRAWFLKLRGLARFKLVFDEEKQGLLEGG
ncbi:hypothetical protein FOWG_17551 [Fusarium oxysporum f. sp. lycopersici MN25]|nr:hypothetical protein FOWG_17551 [Fusarium oxysporum f. sp. lycopersici MN25]